MTETAFERWERETEHARRDARVWLSHDRESHTVTITDDNGVTEVYAVKGKA